MQKSTVMIKITKAQINNAQAIRKLEHMVWDEEVVNQYDIPMFVRFGYVLIAKSGNKLVGAIISYRTNKDEVYVCDLVVDKKYRGLKIAERLYKKLLMAVKGKNVVSFLDPDNIPTIKLHEKLGAKVISKPKNAYDLNEGTRLFIRIKN